MCCLFLSAFGIGPRFALLVWWLFGDKPDAAFDGWLWAVLGWLVAPWTTLAYVVAWGPVNGVSGFWDVLLIALGVSLDLAAYAAKPAQRYKTA